VVRLHRYCRDRGLPYRITFVPDPVAWTEAPESLRILTRQRDRWQRGLMESLSIHRGMLFRRRYGRIGTIAHPYFYFFEGLGPLVEVLGYAAFIVAVAMGWVSTVFIVAFLSIAFIFGLALSIAAVALEELVFRRYARFSDFLQLFVLAILENFGYRQLLTLVRFRAVISAAFGKKGWGDMTRKGFSPPPAARIESAEPYPSRPGEPR
jgi:cellulose synthase/poly-beta-1,6-N-acetylglucosamine synthase-like glycosyltransferase